MTTERGKGSGKNGEADIIPFSRKGGEDRVVDENKRRRADQSQKKE